MEPPSSNFLMSCGSSSWCLVLVMGQEPSEMKTTMDLLEFLQQELCRDRETQ